MEQSGPTSGSTQGFCLVGRILFERTKGCLNIPKRSRILYVITIIAILFIVWVVLQGPGLLGHDAGVVRTLVVGLVVVAALPLHWVVFHWLGQVWLCSGAIAMCGAYTYAVCSLRNDCPAVLALFVAGFLSALMTLIVAYITSWLAGSAIPLFTVVLHLVMLAIIILSGIDALGGSEGLNGISSVIPFIQSQKVSWLAVLIVAFPLVIATCTVIFVSRRPMGRRLRLMGHDLVLFETLGGRRLRSSLPLCAMLGGMLGIAAAFAVSSDGLCSPSNYSILCSLLPVIVILVAAESGSPIVSGVLVLAVLLLEYKLAFAPFCRDFAVASLVLLGILFVPRLSKSLGG